MKNSVENNSVENNSNSKHEANLGRLLFGSRSPMSLYVCLKPTDESGESLSSLDPFETISLGVGRRYFLARLSVGRGFSEQFILLNIYNETKDKNAVSELSTLQRYRDNHYIPLPSVIDFNTGYQVLGESAGYSPTFYCSKTQHFFNVPCPSCFGTLESEEDDNYLYCPRCKELNQKTDLYTFYDGIGEQGLSHHQVNAQAQKTVLLEDVFSIFSKTDQHSSNIPCSGCANAQQCFPEGEKSQASVANESHHIIPFSYESFSVYGFSYFPLSLIDYCELVSGKSKSDLLKKLEKSKEFGRLRVLSESGTFAHRLNEQNYLTVKAPDITSILSIKLRVFMRICDALGRLNTEMDIAGLTCASINMDVSQMYAAGDSFTRARIGFVLPSDVAHDSVVFPEGEDEGDGDSGCEDDNDEQIKAKFSEEKTVPTALSEMLFLMFFKNLKNNELQLIKAVDKLISMVNKLSSQSGSISLSELAEIINRSDQLLSVFSHNNLRYDLGSDLNNTAGSGCELTPQVNQILLSLIRLGLVLTQRVDKQAFSSVGNLFYSFPLIIDELKQMFGLVDLSRESRSIPVSDEQLLNSALREIIDDEKWLDSILSKTQVEPNVINQAAVNDENLQAQYNAEHDKTVIQSADRSQLDHLQKDRLQKDNLQLDNSKIDDSQLDKTVLMNKKLSDDVETDDVLIMSSINRILRQL